MKLYYSPGACSLSPHIALEEAGVKYDAIKVDLKAKKTEHGDDYYAVNSKGKVPFLVTDATGGGLSEGAAIVQYIADQAPSAKLAPANGTMERYHLQEWLNFISTELHKGFSPLFNPATPQDVQDTARANITKQLGYVDGQLAGKDYLMGSQFTVADGYLFTILRWADGKHIDTSSLKNLTAYKARVAARPHVKAAMLAEGLIKAA
jgi:glutathione S-transferase